MDRVRKIFRCQFSDYITPENRDGVIRSLIMQFEGLFAEPEVTLSNDNSFTISLLVGRELTPTLVRDKLLWNQFITSVTTSDVIKQLKARIKLPQAFNEGGTLNGVGPFVDPDTQRSGVNETLYTDGEPVAQTEYDFDMGDRPAGPPVRHRQTPKAFALGSIKQADPTGNTVPGVFFGDGIARDEDTLSDATDVTAHRHGRIFKADLDAGGSQFGSPFDKKTELVDVTTAPIETRGPSTRRDIDQGLGVPLNSWFSEQGAEGTNPSKGKKAPLDPFVGSSSRELPDRTTILGDGNFDEKGEPIIQDSWGNRFSSLDLSMSLHFGYNNEAGHHGEDGEDDE